MEAAELLQRLQRLDDSREALQRADEVLADIHGEASPMLQTAVTLAFVRVDITKTQQNDLGVGDLEHLIETGGRLAKLHRLLDIDLPGRPDALRLEAEILYQDLLEALEPILAEDVLHAMRNHHKRHAEAFNIAKVDVLYLARFPNRPQAKLLEQQLQRQLDRGGLGTLLAAWRLHLLDLREHLGAGHTLDRILVEPLCKVLEGLTSS